MEGDGSVRGGLGKKSDRTAAEDRRGLFAFVEPTSFISSEQPHSAERLHDRNQSEGNRPYSSAEAQTHRYRHEEQTEARKEKRREVSPPHTQFRLRMFINSTATVLSVCMTCESQRTQLGFFLPVI